MTVRNNTDSTKDIRVHVTVKCDNETIGRDGFASIKAGKEMAVRVPMTIKNAKLWDASCPYLYRETVDVYSLDKEREEVLEDTSEDTFGIRSISADSTDGLLINGRSVNLKGGCNHHDNGLLGAVSLYDAEERKLRLMKEAGYNAVRISHNPPSKEMLKAADTVGMYVFNEAFDVWWISKQSGDYSLFFDSDWQKDLKAFITRDRNHPSVIFWSTGNEVEERGGLGDGYHKAEKLAAYVRTLDDTRLVSHGVCSMWNGTRDDVTKENLLKLQKAIEVGAQNFDPGENDSSWEEATERFVNCLDVVGYNYMDSHYAYDHKRYPERVIVGTESYPNQMDKVWERVETMPWVIGDFTWTSFDYIGEAGIGKSEFMEKNASRLKAGALGLSAQSSIYPWRLSNDADFSLTGEERPQCIYRKIVWGSKETGLYTQNPEHFEQDEVVSRWGWNEMTSSWNYEGYEGKPVKVYVYTRAEEVELFLNGRSIGRRPAGNKNRFTAVFEIPYEKGELKAVSILGNQNISEAKLETTGMPVKLALVPEKTMIPLDGESLCYVRCLIIDNKGRRVPDAKKHLTAELKDAMWEKRDIASIAGFGSDNPITEENYSDNEAETYNGSAMIIIRSGHEKGIISLKVHAEGLEEANLSLTIY